MRRCLVAAAIAFGLWTGLPAALAAASSTALETAALQGQAQSFLGCIRSIQGTARHPMTLAESRRCAIGLPEIVQSSVRSAHNLPHLYLAVNGSMAVLGGYGVAPTDPSNAAYAGCYNTWTNPRPWSSDGVSVVQLNAYGYGNHCNYANVPSNPTVSVNCICYSFSHVDGRWDSNYGRTHLNINSAAGWSNITIQNVPFGSTTWFCRGYVDTNGNQNPGGWCLP
jgi:hypothetical protein